jgi:hypothetical protein
MLYTVMEVSESIGLSKQSVYKKLKVKELHEHVTKRQGITYIDEDGFNLIKDGLKANVESLKDLNNKEIDNTPNEEAAADTENLNVNLDLLNILKDQLNQKDLQLKTKDIQIDEKDNQIHDLHRLMENSQILLKDKPKQDVLTLEEHFQELDNKFEDVREKMANRKSERHKSIFSRIFKK